MGNPAIQTLQDLTNLIQIVGTLTLVMLAFKISRYLTKREGDVDSKLDAIHGIVVNTRDNHLEHLKDDVTGVVKEVRDSNAKVIEAVRDSGDRIVQAIITLKN
jgi:NACalpha-BTF3-like transcription factor